jgi:hypothetical protein
MRKEDTTHRFGPERWVTIRDTGEHAKVEAWSSIASAYRVRSRKRGAFVVTDEEIDEVTVHPEVHRGKHWSRCQAPGCGAPLTPDLPVCESCQAVKCTCGRCQCARTSTAAARARAKTPRKKAAPKAK